MGTVPLVESTSDPRNLATLATYAVVAALVYTAFTTSNRAKRVAVIMVSDRRAGPRGFVEGFRNVLRENIINVISARPIRTGENETLRNVFNGRVLRGKTKFEKIYFRNVRIRYRFLSSCINILLTFQKTSFLFVNSNTCTTVYQNCLTGAPRPKRARNLIETPVKINFQTSHV